MITQDTKIGTKVYYKDETGKKWPGKVLCYYSYGGSIGIKFLKGFPDLIVLHTCENNSDRSDSRFFSTNKRRLADPSDGHNANAANLYLDNREPLTYGRCLEILKGNSGGK